LTATVLAAREEQPGGFGRNTKSSMRIVSMASTAATTSLGTPAPSFALPATDGKTYTLEDIAGGKGTVIAFICNHCPYVKAVIDRLAQDARVLLAEGIGFAAICSNDAAAYPEDSFDNMQRFAKAHKLSFPYLHDADQSVARAYGALCTPDFFGYDAQGKLRYHGRLDEGRTAPPPAGARRELVEGMRAIANAGIMPRSQFPSVGCSIKWKAA
jgi:peroxiredoxin